MSKNKENRFYVYAFLDPRKPGKYEYKNICFLYEPFYIGKGTRNRIKMHLLKSRLNISTPKNNKIKKLLSLNLNPIEQILSNNIKNKDALRIEEKLIKIIGRKDINKGVLTNITNGGEGQDGRIVSRNTRKKISRALRGKFLGRVLTTEWKEKIGTHNAKYWKNKKLPKPLIRKIKLTKSQNPQNQKYRCRKYRAVAPNGDSFVIDNGFEHFCQIHGLLRNKMILVAQGKRHHHKQWKCEYLDIAPISSKDKTYLLTNKNGKRHIVKNIIEFSLNNNLLPKRLYEVAKGKHCVHRGWKCEYYFHD
jgi:hypothetical protein